MTQARRTLDQKACPRCGRIVAWRVIRGPRVNRGRPIPALKQPVPHKRLLTDDPLNPRSVPCEPERTLRERR